MPFFPPENLPYPEIKPTSFVSPALAGGFLLPSTWESHLSCWDDLFETYSALEKIVFREIVFYYNLKFFPAVKMSIVQVILKGLNSTQLLSTMLLDFFF